MRAAGIVLLLLLLAPSATAQADAPAVPVRVDEPDGVARVRWISPTTPGTWTGFLRVTAAQNVTIEFLVDDLTRDGGGNASRAAFTPPPTTTLLANRTVDLPLAATGLQEGSTYRTNLTLTATDREGMPRMRVPIVIDAVVPARLELSGATGIHLVRCGNGLTCGIAGFVFPGDADPRIRLAARNAGTQDARVVGGSLWLAGSSAGRGALLPIEGTTTFPARAHADLDADLAGRDLPAGSYNGTLTLLTDDGRSISAPVQMDVRHGPTWPFLVLVLGVLLGFGYHYWKDKLRPRAAALKRIRSLRRLAALLSEKSREAIAAPLAHLSIVVQDGDVEGFKEKADKIQAAIPVLSRVDRVEAEAAGDKALAEAVKTPVADARRAASEGKWDVLEKEAAAAQEALKGPRPKLHGLDRAPPRVVDVVAQETAILRRIQVASWFALFVVVALLALFGMSELYVENRTFGADVGDYAALLAWGFTGQATAQSLRDAIAPKAPA